MSNPIQNFVVVSPTAIPAAEPQPNDVWERIATALERIAAAINHPAPQPVYEPEFDAVPEPEFRSIEDEYGPDPFSGPDNTAAPNLFADMLSETDALEPMEWESAPTHGEDIQDTPPPWVLASIPVVTVGEREVTFPNNRTANVVRNLLEGDPINPTTVYMAADAAGFNLPPMGQDIGAMVPPTELQPGDVVFSDFGAGVYLGEGEVLMEDQSVMALSDVASFSNEHQGLFRLEDPDNPDLIPNI